MTDNTQTAAPEPATARGNQRVATRGGRPHSRVRRSLVLRPSLAAWFARLRQRLARNCGLARCASPTRAVGRGRRLPCKRRRGVSFASPHGYVRARCRLWTTGSHRSLNGRPIPWRGFGCAWFRVRVSYAGDFGIDDHLPELRYSEAGNYADRCLPVLL